MMRSCVMLNASAITEAMPGAPPALLVSWRRNRPGAAAEALNESARLGAFGRDFSSRFFDEMLEILDRGAARQNVG